MNKTMIRRVVVASASAGLALSGIATVPMAQAAPPQQSPGQGQGQRPAEEVRGPAKALAQQIRALSRQLQRMSDRYERFALELEDLSTALPEDVRQPAIDAAGSLRLLAGEAEGLIEEVRTALTRADVRDYRKDRIAIVKEAAPAIELLDELREGDSAGE